jgi:hypothetical protein
MTNQPVVFPWGTGWAKAVTDSNPHTEKTLKSKASLGWPCGRRSVEIT